MHLKNTTIRMSLNLLIINMILFQNQLKNLFDFLNSKKFLYFLQEISSVKETLISDSQLNGGGLHEIKRGGILKIHTLTLTNIPLKILIEE